MTLSELNHALLIAHEQAGKDSLKIYLLVDLYYQAYTLTLKHDETAAYFYLTNAYVYALDTDHGMADDIEVLLKNANRL